MSRTQRITTTLFWIAFGVFLSVSVPHLAWVVHSYEPQQTDGWNIVWWPLSYGFALAIDAVVCWLSYVKSTGEKAGDTWVAWVFIVALVLMSWYFNLIYAQAHDPSHRGIDIWTTSLFGLINIGTLTPIIVSALPVFIIAYAYMHGKIANAKPKAPKSLEELQQEANEAEQKAAALIAIQQANTEVKKASAQSQKELVKAYFAWGKHGQNEKPNELKKEAISESGNTQGQEPKDKPIAPPINQPVEPVSPAGVGAANHQEEPGVEDGQKPQSEQTASRRTMTIEEVVNATGLTERRVKNLIAKRTFRVTPRNQNRILISSVDEWLKITPNDKETKELPVVQLASNNNHH